MCDNLPNYTIGTSLRMMYFMASVFHGQTRRHGLTVDIDHIIHVTSAKIWHNQMLSYEWRMCMQREKCARTPTHSMTKKPRVQVLNPWVWVQVWGTALCDMVLWMMLGCQQFVSCSQWQIITIWHKLVTSLNASESYLCYDLSAFIKVLFDIVVNVV